MLLMSPKMLDGLIHPNMVLVLMYLTYRMGTLDVTSLFRRGDSGVHGQFPVRGVDVRCRDLNIARAIEAQINRDWSYDNQRPEKKVALAHDAGDGIHLHLQVHDRTRMR